MHFTAHSARLYAGRRLCHPASAQHAPKRAVDPAADAPDTAPSMPSRGLLDPPPSSSTARSASPHEGRRPRHTICAHRAPTRAVDSAATAPDAASSAPVSGPLDPLPSSSTARSARPYAGCRLRHFACAQRTPTQAVDSAADALDTAPSAPVKRVAQPTFDVVDCAQQVLTRAADSAMLPALSTPLRGPLLPPLTPSTTRSASPYEGC
jgi:hypothetical protein